MSARAMRFIIKPGESSILSTSDVWGLLADIFEPHDTAPLILIAMMCSRGNVISFSRGPAVPRSRVVACITAERKGSAKFRLKTRCVENYTQDPVCPFHSMDEESVLKGNPTNHTVWRLICSYFIPYPGFRPVEK